jgi:peptide deformylase
LTVEDGVALVTDMESCLSLPYCTGQVPRHERIRVRNRTLANAAEIIEAEGHLARVIQHEMDHLVGRTYIDRLPTPEALDADAASHIARRARRTMEKLEVKAFSGSPLSRS